MTPRDLAFLKNIQDKMQAYNACHKQVHLSLIDTWNPAKDRYDYCVYVKTSLDPSKPFDKKSIDKAVSIAKKLNSKIWNSGYGKRIADTVRIEIKYI